MGILFILRPPRGGNRQTERLAGWGGTKDVVSAITWARSCIKPTPSERYEISAEDKKKTKKNRGVRTRCIQGLSF